MSVHPSAQAPVRTTCPYCGTGCGVLGSLAPATPGDPDHPTNFGRVCAKGSALGETLGLTNRLLHPRIGGTRVGWDVALNTVAGRFSEAIREHGPDSAAFYVSGQLLTEDYYVANKLMKGFIGSANIDTNSRLCMSSSVAGHKRAFGEDLVPCCYEDLDEADLVVLVGSNAAWCHPILFRRIVDARARRGTKVVVIDPRRTATAADADLFLATKPGTDVALYNGLLVHLARAGALNEAFLAASTQGFAEALAAARADGESTDTVARVCDLPLADLTAFYDLFTATRRVVTVYSQGVNQSSRGTDKVNAIINCHLATGRIGGPGMGPFSFTGQPNAMGGREVGGLANQLAAHMALENAEDIDRVCRFWNAPSMARTVGLKAIDMFDAAAAGHIKALWIMGTNPAASMPDSNSVRKALKACDFVVVSDCVPDTDTARLAHVLLPAAAWGEKDGTVTNSERRISRQRPFMPLPGEARPDWWMVTQVAARMGFAEGFAFSSPAEIFQEHAGLSGFENDGARVFDIAGLAKLSALEFEQFTPVQWPVPSPRNRGTARLFSDGRYPTPDGRAHFIPVQHEAPANATTGSHPLVFNTGRVRDQWHTMTRTGDVPRLMAAVPEPVVDLNPTDALLRGMAEGSLARITSSWGSAIARVRLTADQRPGEVFLPMHWTDATARGSAGRITSRACDAVSGQPELKYTPCAVKPFEAQWEGLLLSRERFRPKGFGYWGRRAVEGGHAYALAGEEPPDEGVLLGRTLLGSASRLLDYQDRRKGMFRAVEINDGGRISSLLLISRPGALPELSWLLGLFASAQPLSSTDQKVLLAARSAAPQPAEGRIVCSCFGVGAERIERALDGGASSAEELGRTLRCGTNCGSCLPEVRELIRHHIEATAQARAAGR